MVNTFIIVGSIFLISEMDREWLHFAKFYMGFTKARRSN